MRMLPFRRLFRLLLLPILLHLILIDSYLVTATATDKNTAESAVTDNDNDNDGKNINNERIHIAIVSCGSSRGPEALTSMRSALLMTQHPLSFHIFHSADDGNDVFFTKALSSWQQQQQQQNAAEQPVLDFSLYTSNLSDDYATLFAPCAAQRLFLHQALPESIERVLYVDSDTLFLSDVWILWKEFFNDNNETAPLLAGLVPEHQATSKSAYYSEQTNHPYYQDDQAIGLNSGVLLLNLRHLRANPWNQELHDYLQNYTLQYYDQDLMNIYFYHHPEKLKVLSCDWNFRSDHCFFATQHCSSSTAGTGIRILHGSRGSFHAPISPLAAQYSVHTFQTLHRAFSMFPVTELGSAAAVRDAWLWLSSPQQQAQTITNYCDALVPAIVKRQLTDAATAAATKRQVRVVPVGTSRDDEL
jgi:UDP-xylose:glucoside alpha-1,3-xylosyltransferase